METIRSIIRGDLPPVGSPIHSSPSSGCSIQLDGYHSTWLDSGTSALALALLAAKEVNPTILHPEVILPAYSCPDLVSACEFADCHAKLIDIRKDGWGIDLIQLKNALSPNTLALVGVNFLGIREDWAAIKNVLDLHQHSVFTIEDNAQWFPNFEEKDNFYSDCVVFSFGKGKPLSLLGGGVLFSKQHLGPKLGAIVQGSKSSWMLRRKIGLYNQILKPNFYWFLNHNPIYKPGATRFKKLQQIQKMDQERYGLIQTNYIEFIKSNSSICKEYDAVVHSKGYKNEIWPRDESRIKRLLRYPFICVSRQHRDTFLKKLNQQGLGASSMYQNALVNIDCTPAIVDHSLSQRVAQSFAERLITLPCHNGVTTKHKDQICHWLATSIEHNQQPLADQTIQ